MKTIHTVFSVEEFAIILISRCKLLRRTIWDYVGHATIIRVKMMTEDDIIHKPMSFNEHIDFHARRIIRRHTLTFIAFIVPVVLLGAYLDLRLIGVMNLRNYILTCVWEYAIIMIAFEVGYWRGLRTPQFKFEGEK